MAERYTIDDDAWAKLQEQFRAPEWELAKVAGLQPGDIVLRNPSELEYRAFVGQVTDEAQKPVALQNLLLVTTVWPDRATMTKWLARWPGLINNGRLVGAMQYLNGSADALAGKG